MFVWSRGPAREGGGEECYLKILDNESWEVRGETTINQSYDEQCHHEDCPVSVDRLTLG